MKFCPEPTKAVTLYTRLNLPKFCINPKWQTCPVAHQHQAAPHHSQKIPPLRLISSILQFFFRKPEIPTNSRLSKISKCMKFQTPKLPTPWCIATAPALKQFFGPSPRFTGGLQDLCDAHAPVAADKDFAEVPWIQRGSAAKVVDPHVEPMIIAKIYKYMKIKQLDKNSTCCFQIPGRTLGSSSESSIKEVSIILLGLPSGNIP